MPVCRFRLAQAQSYWQHQATLSLVILTSIWVVATQRSDVAWLAMIFTTALICLRAYSRTMDPYQSVELGSRVWMAYLALGSVALSTAFSSHGDGPLSGTERVLLHLGMLLMMMQLHLFAVPPLGHALLVALFMVTAIMSAPVENRLEEVLLTALVLSVATVCRHLMEVAQRRAHVQLLRMTDLEGRAQAGRLVDSRLNHLLKNKAGVVRFLNERALEQLEKLAAERGGSLSPSAPSSPSLSNPHPAPTATPTTPAMPIGDRRPRSPMAPDSSSAAVNASTDAGAAAAAAAGPTGGKSASPVSALASASASEQEIDALQSLREQHELLTQMVDWIHARELFLQLESGAPATAKVGSGRLGGGGGGGRRGGGGGGGSQPACRCWRFRLPRERGLSGRCSRGATAVQPLRYTPILTLPRHATLSVQARTGPCACQRTSRLCYGAWWGSAVRSRSSCAARASSNSTRRCFG